MAEDKAPFFPIIYVRGYAMTQEEINDTSADPFCGFNLGSTVYRATPDKDRPARKFIFESPVIRLGSDYGYCDVFDEGRDIDDPEWNREISVRSIIVYHYYDPASTLLGVGAPPDIKDFAKGLGKLILRTREVICNNPENGMTPDRFRCYLVAHSMGGLVCRAFLQNKALGNDEARRCVDKVFTYATPHNGIEMGGINVPKWLSMNDMNNFNRDCMARYLGLVDLKDEYPGLADILDKENRVDYIPEDLFPSERLFCMVGTNRSDYEAAMGISRTFAGHGSDGLVKIENASVWGIDRGGKVTSCPTAYAYRSHSGYFGIVNSEEAYQNLTRFLFGDVRVDVYIEVDEVRLPEELQGEPEKVDALYQFEILASPRGKRWSLTRRVSEEDSVACRSHKALAAGNRDVYASTIFLSKAARVDKVRPSLAYLLTLGVRVPDYEVERKLWLDKHYEGGYLFHDSLIVEIVPPENQYDQWQVRYGWQSVDPVDATTPVEKLEMSDGKIVLAVPFDGSKAPGIKGKLKFLVSGWR